jgi:hypothetical protein
MAGRRRCRRLSIGWIRVLGRSQLLAPEAPDRQRMTRLLGGGPNVRKADPLASTRPRLRMSLGISEAMIHVTIGSLLLRRTANQRSFPNDL